MGDHDNEATVLLLYLFLWVARNYLLCTPRTENRKAGLRLVKEVTSLVPCWCFHCHVLYLPHFGCTNFLSSLMKMTNVNIPYYVEMYKHFHILQIEGVFAKGADSDSGLPGQCR